MDERPDLRGIEANERYATYLARGAIYGRSWSGFRRWLGEVDDRFARENTPAPARATPPAPAREVRPQ